MDKEKKFKKTLDLQKKANKERKQKFEELREKAQEKLRRKNMEANELLHD